MRRVYEYLLIFIVSAGLNLACGDLELEESEEGETSHYPGYDCGSCHGNQARSFSVAGTIYTDSTGTTAAPGEIIIIKDFNGNELFRLTSDSVGNFYTNTTLVYPARAQSLTGTSMSTTFDLTGSSCNRSGCHDSLRRIY